MGLFNRRRADSAPSDGPAGAAAAEPTEALKELAQMALAHAVASVVPEGGPLIPFALVETAEGRSIARFMAELTEAQQEARTHVRAAPGALRAAVAWDGYLTYDGRRQDAVFVEASDRDRASIVVAHPYHDAPGTAAALGNPILVGRGEPLL
jgi:hypothetical protein